MKAKEGNKKGATSSINRKDGGSKKHKDLSIMSVSDFMNSAFSSDDSDDEQSSSKISDDTPKVNGNSQDLGGSSSEDQEMEVDGSEEEEEEDVIDDEEKDDVDDEEGEEEGDEEDEEVGDEVEEEKDKNEDGESDDDSDSDMFDSTSHKKSLKKLRKTDPDFYKFLEENDKNLLEFDASDSESDDEKEEKVHKPAEKLEVASDESDYEEEGKEVDERVVTLKMVQAVRDELQDKKECKSGLKKAIKMFHSALQRVVAPSDVEKEPAEYIVEASSVFNAVIQMCVLELPSAIKLCLKIPAASKVLHSSIRKSGRWLTVKKLLRIYLSDLEKFLDSVSSPHILTVLLKHLHQLAMFIPHFPSLKKPLLKRLIKLWCSGEDTLRVIAFLCILKITTNEQENLLEKTLKMMYLAYVRNCKFVSPSTLPSIQFMRRSLSEMFALDDATSYQHVFLYIRQLAIHLRNAITLHTKESNQAVYNWQFIMSLHLWVEVLGATANKPCLQPLLYPLVQVIIGTIKLITTAQYYPLRFYCVQMLIQLSRQTGTFIPVLPFLLEVLSGFDFNKRHKKVSMKPMDLTCILRLSKSELHENSFNDAVIDKVYQLMLDYLVSEAHTISFPDTVLPTIIQLKKFVKECKFPNYNRKMKQLLDKIQENSQMIEAERRKVSFALSDRKAIDAWETNMQLKGTPLASYYASWKKVNAAQVAKNITQNEKLGDYKLPTVKKIRKEKPDLKKSGPPELFPSSDESEDEVATALTKTPRKRKRDSGNKIKKNKKSKKETKLGKESIPDEEQDIVQDLRLSDLE